MQFGSVQGDGLAERVNAGFRRVLTRDPQPLAGLLGKRELAVVGAPQTEQPAEDPAEDPASFRLPSSGE